MAPNNINTLVGATTRFITGRNAVQTVYWRTSPVDGKLTKCVRTCEFEKAGEKVPNSVRFQNYNRNFRTHE